VKCTRTVDAGAYVLGALAPTDRAAYERHMAGCAECRNEVAELAVLPGLLGRLDAGTAIATLEPSVQAPPSVLAATLRAVTADRRRYRRRYRWQLTVTGAAAACLALALGLGTVTLNGEPRQPGEPVMAQMQPVDANGSLYALVGYAAATGGGTDISGVCLYEHQSQSDNEWNVHLYVVGRDGTREPVTDWPVGGPAADDSAAQPFHGTAHIAPADIASFELTNDAGKTLL